MQCGPAMVVEKSSTRTPCKRPWVASVIAITCAMRMRTTPPTTRMLPSHSPADGRSLSTTCEAMKVKTSSIWPTARTRAAFSSVMASAQPAEPSTLKMPTQIDERQLNQTLPSCGRSRRAR